MTGARISPLAGKLLDPAQLIRPADLDRCLFFRRSGSVAAVAAHPFRHLGSSRLRVPQFVQRAAHRGDRPGDLPLSQATWNRRPALHRHRYACPVPAGLRHRAGGVRRERGRDDDRRSTTATRRRPSFRTRSSLTIAAAPNGLADGVVLTPSHNPPEDGGFKYNPPTGGPADSTVTGWIEAAANRLLESGVQRRQARPL